MFVCLLLFFLKIHIRSEQKTLPCRKNSSAIHSKELVAYINSLSLKNCITCQKAEVYNIEGVQRYSAGVVSCQPPEMGSIFIYLKTMSGVISCQIHRLRPYEDKRSCNHHPLISLLRRRRDYSLAPSCGCRGKMGDVPF